MYFKFLRHQQKLLHAFLAILLLTAAAFAVADDFNAAVDAALADIADDLNDVNLSIAGTGTFSGQMTSLSAFLAFLPAGRAMRIIGGALNHGGGISTICGNDLRVFACHLEEMARVLGHARDLSNEM